MNYSIGNFGNKEGEDLSKGQILQPVLHILFVSVEEIGEKWIKRLGPSDLMFFPYIKDLMQPQKWLATILCVTFPGKYQRSK